MGRINYGPHLQDPKGILGNVTLDNVVLRDWQMFPLKLDNVVGCDFSNCLCASNETNQPTFFVGYVPPAPDGVPKDTYLRLKGWTKVSWTDKNLCRSFQFLIQKTLLIFIQITRPSRKASLKLGSVFLLIFLFIHSISQGLKLALRVKQN